MASLIRSYNATENLRTEYASHYKLSNAFKYYSESDVLNAFSNEDEYMSAVAKYDSENNAQAGINAY